MPNTCSTTGCCIAGPLSPRPRAWPSPNAVLYCCDTSVTLVTSLLDWSAARRDEHPLMRPASHIKTGMSASPVPHQNMPLLRRCCRRFDILAVRSASQDQGCTVRAGPHHKRGCRGQQCWQAGANIPRRRGCQWCSTMHAEATLKPQAWHACSNWARRA